MSVRTESSPAEAKASTQELRDQARVVGEDLRGLGRAARDVARDKLNDAGAKASEALEEGKERAREVEDRVETYIRRRPMQSVMMAAGAGALLGFLVSRR